MNGMNEPKLWHIGLFWLSLSIFLFVFGAAVLIGVAGAFGLGWMLP